MLLFRKQDFVSTTRRHCLRGTERWNTLSFFFSYCFCSLCTINLSCPPLILLAYPVGLHAPLPPGTKAPQTRTTSRQRWQRTGRTCSATACPEKLSRGHGGTGLLVRLRVQCVHCFVHLWRGHGASFSEHWVLHLLFLLHRHLRPPLRSPARAWWCPSVSESGILSEGRSLQRRVGWLRSWQVLQMVGDRKRREQVVRAGGRI